MIRTGSIRFPVADVGYRFFNARLSKAKDAEPPRSNLLLAQQQKDRAVSLHSESVLRQQQLDDGSPLPEERRVMR